MNIFPNPTNDKLNLSFNLHTSQDYRWLIYNELGAIVSQSRINNNYSSLNIIEKINVSELKAGLYFISLITNDHVITKELIIN